jgi:hypothetical protein
MPNDFRFSLIVPTRNRHDTLKFTLDTCIKQRFDNYEIIVCDNCSSPATKDVVDSLKSDKIKYVRASQPLAMSDNWELALSKASGEYVTVIGDDDGLMPNALYSLDQIIKSHQLKIVQWDRLVYNWPNVVGRELPNRIYVPLMGKNRIIQSRKIISLVANSKMGWHMLPMIYNSVIHRDLIESLRKKTGRIFKSITPDIYSGFAFAYLVEKYVSISYPPIGILGRSSASTGINGFECKEESPIVREHLLLNEQAGFSFPQRIPKLILSPVASAEPFERAKEALFSDDNGLSIDRKLLIRNCIKELKPQCEDDWKKSLFVLRESLLDDASLIVWFDKEFLTMPMPHSKQLNLPTWNIGLHGNTLQLNAADFGVKDVAGAADLCSKILGFSEIRLDYGSTPLKVNIKNALETPMQSLLFSMIPKPIKSIITPLKRWLDT